MDVQSSTQLVSVGAIILAIIALARDFVRGRSIAERQRGEVARVLAGKDAEVSRILAEKNAEVAKLRETAVVEADRRRDEFQQQLLTLFSQQQESARVLNGVVQKLQEGAVQREKRQGELNVEIEAQGDVLEGLQAGTIAQTTLLQQHVRETKPAVDAILNVPERMDTTNRVLETIAAALKTLPEATQDKLKPDIAALFQSLDDIKSELSAANERMNERMTAIEKSIDDVKAEIVKTIADAIPAPKPASGDTPETAKA